MEAEVVLLTAPAPQTLELLPEGSSLAETVAAVRMAPVWAGMLAFEEPLAAELDGVFVQGPVFSWVARNGSKPGRPHGECWVVHATPDWTLSHLEASPAEVLALLRPALGEALGVEVPPPSFATAHRWRYATVERASGHPGLWSPDELVGAAGDWCAQRGRVEGAWLSGRWLAGAVLRWAAAMRVPSLTPF